MADIYIATHSRGCGSTGIVDCGLRSLEGSEVLICTEYIHVSISDIEFRTCHTCTPPEPYYPKSGSPNPRQPLSPTTGKTKKDAPVGV
jgi:hypothetical protein